MLSNDINKMPTLFVETTDGERVKLGSVSSWKMITEPPIIDGNSLIYTDIDELTLKIKQSYSTPDAIFCLLYGRLPSNNWLKNHGWPLRRKKTR